MDGSRRRVAAGVRHPRVRLLATAVLVLLAGLVVGCAGAPPPPPPAPVVIAALPPVPVEPPAAKPPIPRTKPATPPGFASRPTPIPATLAVTDLPTPLPAQPTPAPAGMGPESPDLKALVGLSEAETARLLGQPDWAEDIPPGRTWQYASDRCVLRVFFFMEVATRDFRSLSYDLTSTDDRPNVAQQCYAELLAQASWPADG